MLSALAIGAAGLVAGTVNTVVGSGTLVTFPVLVALGYPPLVANVSNTIGLMFGSMSGAYAYRSELQGQGRRTAVLSTVSLAGGVAGAVLLLGFPGSTFRRVVPVLVLAACILVAAQPLITRWLAARRKSPTAAKTSFALLVAVLATATYGGYFGAAQGVVLISLLGIFLADGLQRLNAVKNVLVMLVNLVAGAIFAFSGHVSWPAAGVLAVGAVAGGQVGGAFGKRLPQVVLRGAIVIVGVVAAVALLV
ncbi:MAG: sulfite exporter TauE/SafE family protein [Acidimicrobiales bacterium]